MVDVSPFARNSLLRPVLRKLIYDVYVPVWNSVTSRYSFGTNVFERDWDALIVLDTCRVDALRKVAPEYDFIGEVESIWSVGSYSAEWMLKTFTRDYLEDIQNTVLVTENGWAHRILNDRVHTESGSSGTERSRQLRKGIPNWNPVTIEDFLHYENVRELRDDDTILHPESEQIPNIVTDRAIAVGREYDFDRLIVHHLLPHSPFLVEAIEEDRPLKDYESDFATGIRNGTVDRSEIFEKYLDNLRLVLDHVEILLENLDAESVVITADHGEAFGERGIFEHPHAWPTPEIKKVPWAETTATDTGEYEPEFPPPSELSRSAVEENLANLGYL